MGMDLASKDAAKALIERSTRILVTPHANVDPDGVSSALAMGLMLQAMGKEVTILCPEAKGQRSLDFLPGFAGLAEAVADHREFIITLDCSGGMAIEKLRYTVEGDRVHIIVTPRSGQLSSDRVGIEQGEPPYDLIVVMDTADLPLLGSLYRDHVTLFNDIPILNIDHHISNTGFGQVQIVDPTAASATEVLYHWFSSDPAWRILITKDIATLLLTGLITDTRSFQNANTTPRSLEVAAALIDAGASQQEIIQRIYKTKPLSTLKIWGRALNRIQVDPRERIVWSSISREDLSEMGAKSAETHGIVDELLSTIPDADLYVLFTEVEEEGMKASLRTSPTIDASVAAARCYGGGGHARAAGFRLKGYGNFSIAVLEAVQKLIAELRRQREEVAQAPVVTLPHLEKLPSTPPGPPVRWKKGEKSPTAKTPPNASRPKGENGAPAPAPQSPSVDILEELTKERQELPPSRPTGKTQKN